MRNPPASGDHRDGRPPARRGAARARRSPLLSRESAAQVLSAASACCRASARCPARPSAIVRKRSRRVTLHRKRSAPGARVSRTAQRAWRSGSTISSALGLRICHSRGLCEGFCRVPGAKFLSELPDARGAAFRHDDREPCTAAALVGMRMRVGHETSASSGTGRQAVGSDRDLALGVVDRADGKDSTVFLRRAADGPRWPRSTRPMRRATQARRRRE